jgi:hypothetical protein
MASIVIYPQISVDNENYSIALTGNIKLAVKSKLDNAVGETQKPIQPKLIKGKSTNKVLSRLVCILSGLDHIKQIGGTAADRTYLYSIDKEVVDLINKHTPTSMIEYLQTCELEEAIAIELSGKIYSIKQELGTRIGFQDSKINNKFIDIGKTMLAQQSAPKIPDWQTALQKAQEEANKHQIQNNIKELDMLEDKDDLQDTN